MELLLLQISLLLLAAKTGAKICRKFNLPEVLGALCSGIFLGPILHWVDYSDGLRTLSNLGVIFLMFLAGLETDFEQLKKAGKSSLAIGASGVFLPLILGFAGAFLFFQDPMENLFLGVILTATSVSITVETLTELGRLNTRAGVNILGAAVVDDILGLILISILLAVSTGGNGSLLYTLGKIVLFLFLSGLAVFFLPVILKGKWNIPKTFLSTAVALALAAAFLSEKAGIAGITGAYLCGLMLSQLNGKETVQKGISSISSGFLSPVFFAGIGLEISFQGLTPTVGAITLVMFLAAVAGKIIGCGIPAYLFKMSKKEALQIGCGMVSRGEVALITANIGLQNHIITQEVFTPTLFIVLLTTIAAPLLLKYAFAEKQKPT